MARHYRSIAAVTGTVATEDRALRRMELGIDAATTDARAPVCADGNPVNGKIL